MIATSTASNFNSFPSKVLDRVEQGDTIVVEKCGKPAAAMIPQPRITSGTELARRLQRSVPQVETAAAVAALIEAMDETP